MNRTTLRFGKLLFLCTPALFSVSFAANQSSCPCGVEIANHGNMICAECSAAAGYQSSCPCGIEEDSNDNKFCAKCPQDEEKKNNKKWIVPAIIAGAAAVALIHNSMSNSPDPSDSESGDTTDPHDQELANQLKKNGPDFSHLYNMSAFMIIGLVKGEWPLVIDFEQQQLGYVELMVRTKTSETFRYRLDGDETGHRHIVLPLPASFGKEPVPALIAITATASKGSDQTLAGFRLLGLGAGERAVGSVAIDKVTIASDKIQSSLGQTAAYSFYSHSNFENADVDFMKVIDEDDGEKHEWINKQSLDGGVSENQWIGEKENLNWNGQNHKLKPSLGAHKLQVRVWHTKGDWVSAWSNSALSVEK